MCDFTEEYYKNKLSMIKDRCRKTKGRISCDLSWQDIQYLYEKQQFCCAITSMSFKDNRWFDEPSIDRLIDDVSYSKENCIVIFSDNDSV